MRRPAAWQQLNVPVRLTASTRSHTAASYSAAAPRPPTPALFEHPVHLVALRDVHENGARSLLADRADDLVEGRSRQVGGDHERSGLAEADRDRAA
jgi:hypothetical protein